MKYLLLFAAAFALTACEKVIDYPLRSTDEKLVVEGLVTDQPGPYTVRLSGTTGYLTNGQMSTRDADLVTITDVEAGLTDTLRRTEAGVYQTTPKLGSGQLNHSYRLVVVRGSQRVEATSRLHPCTPLDSITFVYKQKDTDAVAESGYYTTIYFREPAGRGDYYRINAYTNGVWRNRNELFFFDDELYDGNYGDPEIDYNINPRDTVTVEMRAIDKAAYDFYLGLSNAQQNTGTPFDSPPANAPTNVRGNRVIGLFTACAVRRVTRVAPPKPR
ncbi:MAG: DUF4249 domain-containing protein [Hymenobacteraceae bacterium]|nr:DUF4249 domain-containing protein [Hymenobacteraceae bacterium]